MHPRGEFCAHKNQMLSLPCEAWARRDQLTCFSPGAQPGICFPVGFGASALQGDSEREAETVGHETRPPS